MKEGNNLVFTNEKLSANTYWKIIHYDYDVNGNVTYISRHHDRSASEDSTDWWVWKYTWTGENLTKTEVRQTSYTNRASGW